MDKNKATFNGLSALLLYVLIVLGLFFFLITSCSTPGATTYQGKNLHKFTTQKRYKKSNKEGSWHHPAVTRESRKVLKARKHN
jgi:hypothetical protein